MDLKAYLSKLTAVEQQDFAGRCNTSPGHLKNIAYGYRPAGESLAILIERESKRAVTCETLRPDVDWAFLRGTSASPNRRKAL